jgi:hypothetical protein
MGEKRNILIEEQVAAIISERDIFIKEPVAAIIKEERYSYKGVGGCHHEWKERQLPS